METPVIQVSHQSVSQSSGSQSSSVISPTCMHWLLLSATTTLPLLEAEMPWRLVNSPFSLPLEPEETKTFSFRNTFTNPAKK